MRLTLYIGTILTILVGCGSSSPTGYAGHTATTPSPGATTSPRVLMATSGAKYVFLPVQITVHPGTTVTWMNKSNADHTVTAGSGAWSSANISHGQSYSRKFTTRGRYDYVCGLHGYMIGVVVVK